MNQKQKVYRLFLQDEDPTRFSDAEKIVVKKAIPTLRDVRALVGILGADALEPGVAECVCMLAKGIEEGVDRAVLAKESFPIVLIHETDMIVINRAQEATAFTSKWKTNQSIINAVKNVVNRR